MAAGVRVVALAQEDKSLETHARMLGSFRPAPRFEVVADLDRAATQRWDRTTSYLLDEEGRVAQIFPMLIRSRPSVDAILAEVGRLSE